MGRDHNESYDGKLTIVVTKYHDRYSQIVDSEGTMVFKLKKQKKMLDGDVEVIKTYKGRSPEDILTVQEAIDRLNRGESVDLETLLKKL